MDPWIVQFLTLTGVALGAVASFVSARLLERSRWQRDETTRWDSRRLESYADFAVAIKRHITTAHRVAAALGLPSSGQPLDPASGLPLLAEAEQELSVQWERILMLGSPGVIMAARDWRLAARHLEWFARGFGDDPGEYRSAFEEGGRSRDLFYKAVRLDLGIVSGEVPELQWPPPWRQPSAAASPDLEGSGG
jgi:hypothetical protein